MDARQALPKSIATVCLSGSLPDKLEAAAAAGFDAVEIFENDLLTFEGAPRDVRRIAANLGLGIAIFQPFRDFECVPEPRRARNFIRAARKFDVMAELGTDLILVCSNVQSDAIDDDHRAAADLAELAEQAARRGIRIGYEALAWGRHVNSWSHAWRIVQQAAHPALGLIVDSFHTLSIGDDAAGIASVPGEKLFFVQLADAPRLNLDVLSWSRHFRNFPGQGDLDVAGFLRAVLATGYAGPLSLEIFNDEFRAAPPRPNAVDGLRSLISLEAASGHLPLPPPPVLDGIGFVEFAVDPRSRKALARCLEQLGFHHAGHHRTKDVDLYRQGKVHLVLNAEPDSAAAEHFIQHGLSVCAIALQVDDVPRTLARAEALLCPKWKERIGPGEHQIPALRSPDGTLIYLIGRDEAESQWRDDFHLLDDPAPAGEPALLAIDHIAQALRQGAMDRFVLFYRSIFGLEPAPVVELADRQGLIRSRALSSRDGKVRIPLNVSEGQATETDRFIDASSGPGIQHIAFATADIKAMLQEDRARGLPIVPIPENYYEDLAASAPLDDAALEDLRRLHILYDSDESGEFLHAYTAPVEGRFFFEIVERRGYHGYGARNAPVRLAAQARLRRGSYSPSEFR
ncbi:MAG TPA: TIM barrel protein [Acetobacteraceae bacterium]|nr:TIM barrel protein [Acetobacteraceae bacterium]